MSFHFCWGNLRPNQCSGGPPPCRSCREARAECVFDYSLDQRRKIAAKRRDEDFKSQTLMMESLFEMIRSGDESKVQELLAMIRANVPMGSIAAKVEASMNGPEGLQKRKRSVSPSTSSKGGTSAGDQSGSDYRMEQRGVRPWAGSVEPETAGSRSVSRQAPHRVISSSVSPSLIGPTLALDDKSYPIIDLAQVRALLKSLAWVILFSFIMSIHLEHY
jgi:hypothetical protein